MFRRFHKTINDVGGCDCPEDWTTQLGYEKWRTPWKDCSQAECIKNWNDVIDAQKRKCNALVHAAAKKACKMILKSMEIALTEVCDECSRQ